jgi:hypothetical protein
VAGPAPARHLAFSLAGYGDGHGYEMGEALVCTQKARVGVLALLWTRWATARRRCMLEERQGEDGARDLPSRIGHWMWVSL